jgi:hypothetical protein
VSELPTYIPAVRYYRTVLKLSYETAHRALMAGVIEPDARLDTGSPLFSASPEAIQKNLERLRQHRINTARSRYNLPYAQI